MDNFQFGIITVSDSCSENPSADRSGPRLQQEIQQAFPNATFQKKIVPDEITKIKEALKNFCDVGCDVIFTSGGTGLSPRDVTPEATKEVISKEAIGLSYALISRSLDKTEMAMLSRPICGITGKTLIINFPGSSKAVVECFGFIKEALPHAISVLKDEKTEVTKTHSMIQTKSENVQETPVSNLDSVESKVKLNNVAQRKRASPYKMLEVEAALQIIMKESVSTLETENISFRYARNRVLAEDIFALEPIPPFRAAIQDGYAAISSDNTTVRKVITYVAAGDKITGNAVSVGEVIRISTGAEVPPVCDVVIPVEYTEVIESSNDGEEVQIRIIGNRTAKHIREIGSDISAGSLVLNKFEKLSFSHIGVLATLGKTQVKVFKQPKIGLLSTGNELVDPLEFEPGHIRDANKYTLTNLLEKYGYKSTDFGIAKDEPNAVKKCLESCFKHTDIVITTGGMSMGEFDILKDVLIEDFNAMFHFGRINMKPGKPTSFATLNYNGKLKLYFGLPGNPVSCSVTCILFVLPTLKYLERNKSYRWPIIPIPLNLTNNDERPEYHRVKVQTENSSFTAKSTGNQISSRLNSMVGANGLALIPGKPKENTVQVQQFNETRTLWPHEIKLGSFGNATSPFSSDAAHDIPFVRVLLFDDII